MKSICVYCGSSDAVSPDYLAAARQMGRVLTERGLRLIYGGGKTGLMGAVADGVLDAGGEAVGVIIPSMNTLTLAHMGLTNMEVVPEMHARKARHPCWIRLRCSASRRSLGRMNRCSTLVASIRGGVGHANPLAEPRRLIW